MRLACRTRVPSGTRCRPARRPSCCRSRHRRPSGARRGRSCPLTSSVGGQQRPSSSLWGTRRNSQCPVSRSCGRCWGCSPSDTRGRGGLWRGASTASRWAARTARPLSGLQGSKGTAALRNPRGPRPPRVWQGKAGPCSAQPESGSSSFSLPLNATDVKSSTTFGGMLSGLAYAIYITLRIRGPRIARDVQLASARLSLRRRISPRRRITLSSVAYRIRRANDFPFQRHPRKRLLPARLSFKWTDRFAVNRCLRASPTVSRRLPFRVDGA